MGFISKLIKTGLALGAAYTAYQAAEKTRVETGSYTGETFGLNFMKQAGLNAGLVAESVKAQLGFVPTGGESGAKQAQPQKEGAADKAAEKSACGSAPDYSQASCWLQIPEITKDVDTFFVYPTEYMGADDGAPDYAPLDNPDMVEGAGNDRIIMASAFEDSTNVFMPYYRQSGAYAMKRAYDKTGDVRAALAGIPYEDISAALDYYFEHYNNGRPFIIASHSQGSAINSLVLKDYFKAHPAYYERMVAAYLIGFSITGDYLAANPHLKFAAGESDTGVIVSWNTEGKQNIEENATNVVVMPGAISINPLNWKLDETYAPSSENLGSLLIDESAATVSIGDIGADAQINTQRGVIVTNAKSAPIALTAFFGPASFHNGDYTFYYNNIKDNAAKRIAAYLAGK